MALGTSRSSASLPAADIGPVSKVSTNQSFAQTAEVSLANHSATSAPDLPDVTSSSSIALGSQGPKSSLPSDHGEQHFTTEPPSEEAYTYEPLPEGYIRLVYITKWTAGRTEDEEPSIEIRLEAVKMRQRWMKRYQALSYRWDGPRYFDDSGFPQHFDDWYWFEPARASELDLVPQRATYSIQCNKRRMMVTPNLFGFLARQGRNSFRRRWALWIDALSIDQGNQSEKSVQVGMMDEIYENASSVIVWLGDYPTHSPRKNPLHQSLSRMWEPYLRSKQLFGEMMRADMDRLHNTNMACCINRLQRILECSGWMDRAWTLQEICLAKSAYLQLGNQRIGWDRVKRYAEIGTVMKGSGYNVALSHNIVLIGHYRSSMNSGSKQKRLPATLFFSGLLSRAASNAHDKIYAGVGLFIRAVNPVRLHVDYNLTIGQAMIEATQALIRTDHLRILQYIGGLDSRDDQTTHGITDIAVIRGRSRFLRPSWVPDWTACSNRAGSLESIHLHFKRGDWKYPSIGTSGFLERFCTAAVTSNQLEASGLAFGIVQLVHAGEYDDLQLQSPTAIDSIHLTVQTLRTWSAVASGQHSDSLNRAQHPTTATNRPAPFDRLSVLCALDATFSGKFPVRRRSSSVRNGDWIVYLFGSNGAVVLRPATSENLTEFGIRESQRAPDEDLSRKFIIVENLREYMFIYTATPLARIPCLAQGAVEKDLTAWQAKQRERAAELNCIHAQFTIL